MAVKLSWPVILIAVVVALVVLYLFPVLFLVALIAGAVYAVAYYSRPACPSCRARGTIGLSRSEVVKAEKAYGIVTRTDTTTTRRSDGQGQTVNETSTNRRQERVPTVRTTTRSHYRCSRCGYMYERDSTKEQEDFSREEEQPAKEKIIVEREVAKIPCKYCGNLVDPVRDNTCSKCGAKLF